MLQVFSKSSVINNKALLTGLIVLFLNIMIAVYSGGILYCWYWSLDKVCNWCLFFLNGTLFFVREVLRVPWSRFLMIMWKYDIVFSTRFQKLSCSFLFLLLHLMWLISAYLWNPDVLLHCYPSSLYFVCIYIYSKFII